MVRLVFSPTPCLTDDRRPRYRCFALDTKEEKEEAMMMTVAIRLNYDRGRTDGRPNHLLRRRRTNGRRGREDRPTNDLQMPKAKKAGENAAGRKKENEKEIGMNAAPAPVPSMINVNSG